MNHVFKPFHLPRFLRARYTTALAAFPAQALRQAAQTAEAQPTVSAAPQLRLRAAQTALPVSAYLRMRRSARRAAGVRGQSLEFLRASDGYFKN